MTTIDFYTGVANPLNAVHKLALKVFAAKRNVRIATPDEAFTHTLDQLLWTQPEDGFVPHVMLASPLREVTPIIIDHEPSHEGLADVLINVCVSPPKYFARFERLIEVVGRDEVSATAGRERWQFYKARGYAMTHTDLSKRNA